MANLINQKFNRLLVIEKTDQRKNGSIVWKCLCDCGNITYVTTRELRSNNTKSCGCLNDDRRKERIIKYNQINDPYFKGQHINELILLEKTRMKQNNSTVWKCQCSCGDICYISTSNLKDQINCGNYTKHQKKKYYKDITNQRFGKLIALKPTEERLHNVVVWKCRCDCGNICYKPSSWLIDGSIQSCGCLKSKGEELITYLLQLNNINFECQKKFDTCRSSNNSYYYFDFFINNKYLIEYDGIQHFKQTGWEQLKDIQQRDLEKNQWCKNNNIPLIRIPYTRLPQLCLEDLLLETSQFIIT